MNSKGNSTGKGNSDSTIVMATENSDINGHSDRKRNGTCNCDSNENRSGNTNKGSGTGEKRTGMQCSEKR